MIKLKPCPFCGSKMIDVLDYKLFWMSSCRNCNAIGPGEHKTADQAARAWNERYDFKTKSAALYGKSVKE